MLAKYNKIWTRLGDAENKFTSLLFDRVCNLEEISRENSGKTTFKTSDLAKSVEMEMCIMSNVGNPHPASDRQSHKGHQKEFPTRQ